MLSGLTAECNLSVKTFPKLNPSTQPVKANIKKAMQEEIMKEETKWDKTERNETPQFRIKKTPSLEID